MATGRFGTSTVVVVVVTWLAWKNMGLGVSLVTLAAGEGTTVSLPFPLTKLLGLDGARVGRASFTTFRCTFGSLCAGGGSAGLTRVGVSAKLLLAPSSRFALAANLGSGVALGSTFAAVAARRGVGSEFAVVAARRGVGSEFAVVAARRGASGVFAVRLEASVGFNGRA